MNQLNKFQCIKRGVIDKSAIQNPAVVGTLQDVDDLPFCLLCESQIGLIICNIADQDLIDEAPDGVLFELDVTSYLLADVSLGAVAGNILFEHSSKIVSHKANGEFYYNNATTGAINPNAFIVNSIVDNVGLSALAITSLS